MKLFLYEISDAQNQHTSLRPTFNSKTSFPNPMISMTLKAILHCRDIRGVIEAIPLC
jgi:hypothetical protein